MPDPTTAERLRGLVLSAIDLKVLVPEWPDALIEDYLNIIDNLITVSNLLDIEIDTKLEEIATDLTDGSIPFADSGILAEDSDLFWDNVNKRLGIGTDSPAATLEVSGTVKLPITGITGAGSGSGLDADKLDGHDSTYFAQQTVLAALTITVGNLSDALDDLTDRVDDLETWKGTGWSGSFTNGDAATVTVVDGLITGVA